ncbi:MAG TPA: glycosyltransferase [Planctomycetota bacterium]|nr:glycosyltransferase [Planctomycetota bacterium]
MSVIRKIVVLSVSAGAGHVRAAEALIATAKLHHPGVEAIHIDVMDLVPKLFRKIYAEKYVDVVNRHPALWGYLYHTADKQRDDSTITRIRRVIEKLNTRGLVTKLQELQPDAVICTHFLPAQILSRMIAKKKWATPVWTVVTDFDVHALWVHQRLTGYCAAAEEIAWRMRERGLADTRIEVTGIPIMPVFAEQRSRELCAKEAGIDPKRTTLLVMSGGLGVGAIDQLCERILAIPGDHQVLALAGKNAALLEKLKTIAAKHPGRFFPQGFTRTIERLMTCADLALTKPGGLTTSECLAVGLPMLVVSPIPGQEERNADYLLESGAALKAHDLAGVDFRVRQLLAAPKRLAAMRERALAIATPQAAQAVLRHVLG